MGPGWPIRYKRKPSWTIAEAPSPRRHPPQHLCLLTILDQPLYLY
jgi:hypothetical protein